MDNGDVTAERRIEAAALRHRRGFEIGGLRALDQREDPSVEVRAALDQTGVQVRGNVTPR
jgi:hypothetical protein